MNTLHEIAGAETMRELEGALGEDGARLVSDQYGGTVLYVPIHLPEEHFLRTTLGDDLAGKLSYYFGGVRLHVPKQVARRAKVLELRQAGYTVRDIARQTHYSERQVYRVLRDCITSESGK